MRHGVLILILLGLFPAQLIGRTEVEKTMAQCKVEVEELHQFFQDWFNGVLPKTEEAYERFRNALGDGFEIVPPSGQLLSRDPLLIGLWSSHGRNKDQPMRIWVEDVRVRQISEHVFLATYQEWQERDGETKARLSTAIFKRAKAQVNGVLWQHVHEVWLPQKP